MSDAVKFIPLIFALAACGTEAPAPRTASSQEEVAEPQRREPRFQWKQTGEEAVYTPENIWEAIDGAAEIYVAYGFKGLVERNYECDGRLAIVDIFDQAEPINAFGVFSRERPPDAKPISVGAMAAALEPYQCMMIKGRHYVRVQALDGELNVPECSDLLLMASQDLPGNDELPPELDRLPQKGRVEGSLGFSRESYLGVADLSHCLYAKYGSNGGSAFELFWILERGDKTAETIWREFEGKWKATTVKDLPALYRDIPYRGKVALVRTPDGILGAVDAGDLNQTLKTLEDAIAAD